MNKNNDIKDELDGIAPFLSKIEKTQPFDLPEGYFDEFPAKVREVIAKQESKPEESWLGRLLPRYSYIAASLCFLLIAGGFFFLKNNNSSNINNISIVQPVKTAPTAEYVIEQVDEDIIVEQTSAEPIAKPSVSKITGKPSNVSEEYILDNIEESTITENL